MNPNEKRPERVLQKGDTQHLNCPSCGRDLNIHSQVTSCVCSCGQVLNWGLRKN